MPLILHMVSYSLYTLALHGIQRGIIKVVVRMPLNLFMKYRGVPKLSSL